MNANNACLVCRRLCAGVMLVGLFFVVTAPIGCRRVFGMDALLGERASRSTPSSSGSCNFDLEGPAGETVFFVLGMLNEYQGRAFVEDEDVIEGFYCNESLAAAVFGDAILKLAREQALDLAIRREVSQACLHSYHSEPIANRLNSCYRYQASNERLVQASDGAYRRTALASLGPDLFVATDAGPDRVLHRRRALAYLSGAWARYGRGSEFVFANAQDKARLIGDLLTALGCQDVRIESDVGFIPQTNVVRFEPTDELRPWLRRF